MFSEECSHAGGDADCESSGAGRSMPRVLIVEDEHVARRALRTLLARSGYCAAAAESAEEALTLLENHPKPRVALVDLNLPGMSGIDFIARLQRLEPNLRAVLMTGAGDYALAAALRERHVPYVGKPVDFRHLLTMINHAPGYS